MLTVIRINKFYRLFYPHLNVRFSLKDLSNPMWVAEVLFDVAEILEEYAEDTPRWINKIHRALEVKQW